MIWIQITDELLKVSSTASETWGILKNGNPAKLQDGVWTAVSALPNDKKAIDIDSSNDNTIIVISENNKVYRYNYHDDAWIDLTAGIEFTKISVTRNDCIYGLGTGDTPSIYRYFSEGHFESLSDKKKPEDFEYSDISFAPDGTHMGICEGYLTNRNSSGANTKFIPNCKIVSVKDAANIMFVMENNVVGVYVGEKNYWSMPNKVESFVDGQPVYNNLEGNIIDMNTSNTGICHIMVDDDGELITYRMIKNDPREVYQIAKEKGLLTNK